MVKNREFVAENRESDHRQRKKNRNTETQVRMQPAGKKTETRGKMKAVHGKNEKVIRDQRDKRKLSGPDVDVEGSKKLTENTHIKQRSEIREQRNR